MTRLTVTLTDEQTKRLRREAEAKRLTVSELVRAAIDDLLRESDERSASAPGFIGIASVDLPYNARDLDSELSKTFGKD